MSLHFSVGKKFFNRAGAVLRIDEMPEYTYPTGKWKIIIGRIEVCADGSRPEAALKVVLGPTGHYYPEGESPLDLITEVLDLSKVA